MQILHALIGGRKKDTGHPVRVAATALEDRPMDPRPLPAYGAKEAARYLRLPVGTLRSWMRVGRSAADRILRPLIDIPNPRQECLSFLNLVEGHVLQALNRDHPYPRVPAARLRYALDCVRKEMNCKHPLAERRFEREGLKLFVARFQGVIPTADARQKAVREVIRAYLHRIDYDAAGLAICLYPLNSDDLQQPRNIVIDPHVSFGRASIRGSGVSTRIIADRHESGETVAELAEDYGFDQTQIEEAIRCEHGLAA